jgi:hypothetical protein
MFLRDKCKTVEGQKGDKKGTKGKKQDKTRANVSYHHHYYHYYYYYVPLLIIIDWIENY